MSFFQQLPDTTKVQVLESSRNQLATELISLLLRYGIDPETFNIADVSTVEGKVFGPDIVRLEQVSQGLALIQQKLTALNG